MSSQSLFGNARHGPPQGLARRPRPRSAHRTPPLTTTANLSGRDLSRSLELTFGAGPIAADPLRHMVYGDLSQDYGFVPPSVGLSCDPFGVGIGYAPPFSDISMDPSWNPLLQASGHTLPHLSSNSSDQHIWSLLMDGPQAGPLPSLPHRPRRRSRSATSNISSMQPTPPSFDFSNTYGVAQPPILDPLPPVPSFYPTFNNSNANDSLSTHLSNSLPGILLIGASNDEAIPTNSDALTSLSDHQRTAGSPLLQTRLRTSNTPRKQKKPLVACTRCKLLIPTSKPPSSNPEESISHNDDDPQTPRTSCCHKPICMPCLAKAISLSIYNDWWYHIESPTWISCPVRQCANTVELRPSVEIKALQEMFLRPLLQTLEEQYIRARVFRTTLQAALPVPTPEAQRIAQSLHVRLAECGVVHAAINPNLNPPKLEMLPINVATGTLTIPIFVDLFNRKERECSICREDILDVDADDEAWSKACEGYGGDWEWMVRKFAVKAILPECAQSHPLDICLECLSKHISAQVEALGKSCCNQLPCVSAGCDHIYTHQQIKHLADSDTFAIYDKMQRDIELSSMPNFRWCLGTGCHSGEIYEDPPNSNHVVCSHCGYAMCFACQTPWHKDSICAGPQTSRTREDRANREWLRDHTKQCPRPGCGVPIEKNDGCFHMTCKNCQFEFCWLCLADWSNIKRNYGEDSMGHKLGCYFRNPGAPGAQMLMGNTIEDAR